MKKIVFMILLPFVFGFMSYGQNSLSGRIITVSVHPFAEANLPLHQNKFDNLGYVTLEPGLIISYDRYIYKKFSFRLSTAVMNDRYNQMSGFSQVMIKYKLFKYYKHSLYFGFGPAIHYSTNKRDIENYVNEDDYTTSGNMIYKPSWISGLIEYNYLINKKIDFAVAFNHIHPKSPALSVGIRVDMPGGGGKGCNCPGYR
jgi:hypothetical protein